MPDRNIRKHRSVNKSRMKGNPYGPSGNPTPSDCGGSCSPNNPCYGDCICTGGTSANEWQGFCTSTSRRKIGGQMSFINVSDCIRHCQGHVDDGDITTEWDYGSCMIDCSKLITM